MGWQRNEFYNISFKIWLKDNDIEMCSIHNEGKSIVAERFVRTLKTKIYKYLTSISKNMHIDKLDDIINEYKYHRTIKIKPVDVEDNTHIDSMELHPIKDPKFKVGDHLRISKYRNMFTKGYKLNWSEEVFIIKKLKIQFHGHMLLMI